MQSEGQLCTDLELVLSGEGRVYEASPAGRQITLYEIGQREACMLDAARVLSDTPSPMNAMAITDVSYLSIPAKDLRNLISKYEDTRAFVLGALSRRFVAILGLIR